MFPAETRRNSAVLNFTPGRISVVSVGIVDIGIADITGQTIGTGSGFIGSVALLVVYMLLVYRILLIGYAARNNFSKLFCFGFAVAFFVYVTVNMSMVLGLLPIVGAPLPIMSYGGSSMLSIMIGLGIVMSWKVYEQDEVT